MTSISYVGIPVSQSLGRVVLLKRFSGNPEVEKARAEFERAQKVGERFHKFVEINPTSLNFDQVIVR